MATLHNRSFHMRNALFPKRVGWFRGGISSIHLLRVRSISINRLTICTLGLKRCAYGWEILHIGALCVNDAVAAFLHKLLQFLECLRKSLYHECVYGTLLKRLEIGGTKDASFDLSVVVFHCTVVYASLLLERNGIVMERCNPPI